MEHCILALGGEVSDFIANVYLWSQNCLVLLVYHFVKVVSYEVKLLRPVEDHEPLGLGIIPLSPLFEFLFLNNSFLSPEDNRFDKASLLLFPQFRSSCIDFIIILGYVEDVGENQTKILFMSFERLGGLIVQSSLFEYFYDLIVVFPQAEGQCIKALKIVHFLRFSVRIFFLGGLGWELKVAEFMVLRIG